ncbi:flagellin [Bacillus sp. CMF12]|uniref:flagellin N-terminal helical domain-containing protein n=1 Tax=Bacillus sp. CMF12 TaxID=2884834 RepID=UPI00207A79AF|nr:flagellin [Bacillus sp. CMF12]USK49565.1 flagellin [Bacillus sp. CMF12]
MRINHNIAALNTYRQLNNANGAQGKSMEKLSSGMRINRAGDDAAGLAISEKMRGQIRGLDQASKNSQDGISLIQTTEGALNESHAILQRMRELGVQASSETYDANDIGQIDKELVALAEELDNIATNTKFNGKDLLVSGGTTHEIAIGANAESLTITVAAADTASLGVDAYLTSGTVTDRASAQTLVTAVDTAIANVSSNRAALGAVQNRLEHTINNLGTTSENLTAAESRIRDVDMAKEMMNQTKNSILSQAAQAMLAQANQQPQGVLQLLR